MNDDVAVFTLETAQGNASNAIVMRTSRMTTQAMHIDHGQHFCVHPLDPSVPHGSRGALMLPAESTGCG